MSADEYNENEEFESNEDSYEPDYEEEEEKPRKGSRVVLIIAVLILVGLNVFLGINIYNQTEEIRGKEREIAALDSQKQVLILRADSLEGALRDYSKSIDIKDDSLTLLLMNIEEYKKNLQSADAEIGKLKWYRNEYVKFKRFQAEAEESRERISKLQEQLQSEKSRAESAENANDTLNQMLKNLENEKAKLEGKVELGQRLRGSVKSLEGFREKPGKDPKSTTKASQANMLRVSYLIAANDIAKKETKTLYFVVKQDGNVITEDGKTFELDGGKKISYSYKTDVKYNGKLIDDFVDITLPDDMSSGMCSVELFLDNKLFGVNQILFR